MYWTTVIWKSLFKVAEHRFQVPMPNSPLLLNYLICFGACFLQESRLTTEVFILTFWLGCALLPWQWHICFRSKDINVFVLCKLGKWWRINCATKMVKYWIKNISWIIGAVIFKLGTRNVHHIWKQNWNLWCLCQGNSLGFSLFLSKPKYPNCATLLSGTGGPARNRHGSNIV